MIGSADRAEPTMPDERRHYLAHSEVSIAPRDRLVVAGILCPDTIADLEPDARVNALLPHDAELVLERTDPDLVLVESSALGAGGAWAGAGEPSVVDVAWRLLRVLEVARALGQPTVLWWSNARHAVPSLIPFESRFDVVLSTDVDEDRIDRLWDRGVQLSRFSPVGIGRDRPFHPVTHGRWEQAPPRGLRSFVDMAAAALAHDQLELWIDAEAVTGPTWLPKQFQAQDVRRVVGIDLPDLYRGHGLFLAEPLTTPPGQRGVSTRTLRELASGARVVSGPNETLAAELGEWIDWTADAVGIGAAVRSAAGQGPRTAADLRRLLRGLFLKHDTSGAVARLTRLVGVREARRRRTVCVVTRLDENARPETFVDAVILQRHRPSEALIAADDPADAKAAISELERAGIAARTPRPPGPERGLAPWAADHTSAAWLWVWSPRIEHDRDFLLDAVIAGITTGASAIGRGRGPDDGFLDGSGLTGRIVSHDAATRLPDIVDGSLTAWTDRGARVYAIGTDLEER
jgi:hypothetical protein